MRLGVVIAIAGCGRVGFDVGVPSHGDGMTTDTIVAAGLIAWYPMDAITATGIADATGRAQDGLCPIDSQGQPVCPTTVPGKIDNAVLFDGAHLLEVRATPALRTTSGFTVAAWVNITTAPAVRACVATKLLDYNFHDTWGLCIEPTRQLVFTTVANGAADALLSTAAVGVAAWHHMAIRWDGTTKTISLDGADVGSDRAACDFIDQSIFIGADFDSGTDEFDFSGAIDDLRIYDRALTQLELAQLAR
jgi:concanavalin A-like lectin/glucanase superfamily protein